MKRIIICIILLFLFLIPYNVYSVDMPGITSNEVVNNNDNNTSKNLFTDLKDSLINYDNDDVMKYSIIIFSSLSFIVIFIYYKKSKLSI